MREMQLTQGKVALVDDEDFGRLSGFKWSAFRRGNNWHAARYAGTGRCDNRNAYLHHEVLAYVPIRGRVIDHINGDGLDNRKANLRECSIAENVRSQRGHVDGGRFKGIVRRRGNWVAQIRVTIDGKQLHPYLGEYRTPEEAARAYDMAAIKYHGEFARTNFPRSEYDESI